MGGLEYMAWMLRDLRKIAATEEYPFLVYLLEMAAIAAEEGHGPRAAVGSKDAEQLRNLHGDPGDGENHRAYQEDDGAVSQG